MAIFRKIREDEAEPRPVPRDEPMREERKPMERNNQASGMKSALGLKKDASIGTVLGENCTFEGKIVCGGTLRIDGKFEGEIVAKETLIIGPSAKVNADLTAKAVLVNGRVKGNIHGEERVEVQSSAEVIGDIETRPGSLIVEGGAKIDGKCMMVDMPSAAEAPKPRPEPKPVSATPSKTDKPSL